MIKKVIAWLILWLIGGVAIFLFANGKYNIAESMAMTSAYFALSWLVAWCYEVIAKSPNGSEWLVGAKPIAGVKYSLCGSKSSHITLTDDDISSGIVRVKFIYSEDSYHSFRMFHILYSSNGHSEEDEFNKEKAS